MFHYGSSWKESAHTVLIKHLHNIPRPQRLSATNHVGQCNVEEHAPGQGEDPVGREAVAGQDAKPHAQVAAAGRKEELGFLVVE